MATMLTSGSAGRANMRMAIEEYRCLFADQIGRQAGDIIVNGTALLPFGKRIWRLEELYVDLMKKLGKDPDVKNPSF